MAAITDDKFDKYLTTALEGLDKRIKAWNLRFTESAYVALSNTDLFEIVAAKSVYQRVQKMMELGNYRPRVDMIRDYAESTLLTFAIRPQRTSEPTVDLLRKYENAAWADLLSDIRTINWAS